MAKINFTTNTLTASATTDIIDLNNGTLCGLLLEGDLTSTSFTITVARTANSAFVTVKDPEAGGADKTYTLGATATGFFPIAPQDTAGFKLCKIVFDSSETATVYTSHRNME